MKLLPINGDIQGDESPWNPVILSIFLFEKLKNKKSNFIRKKVKFTILPGSYALNI